MPVIGVHAPDVEHSCRPPWGLFHRRYTVWKFPACGDLWRKEPPQSYADVDMGWYYQRYSMEAK